MDATLGAVLIVFGLLAWAGQTFSFCAPRAAQRAGLVEAESAVEPVYWADIRGEALWDVFTLWTLAVAGVLLLLDHAAWPYFGLVAGGSYFYFAGRGILTRLEMRNRGFRIGTASSVRVGLLVLLIWAAIALATIIHATKALDT